MRNTLFLLVLLCGTWLSASAQDERQQILDYIEVANTGFVYWNALNERLVEANTALSYTNAGAWWTLQDVDNAGWQALLKQERQLQMKYGRSTTEYTKAFDVLFQQLILLRASCLDLVEKKEKEAIKAQFVQIKKQSFDLIEKGYDFSLMASIAYRFEKEVTSPELAQRWDATAQAKNIIMALRFQSEKTLQDYIESLLRIEPRPAACDEISVMAQMHLHGESLKKRAKYTMPYYQPIEDKKLFEYEMNKVFNTVIAPETNKLLAAKDYPIMPFVLEPLPYYYFEPKQQDTTFKADDITTLAGAKPIDLVVLIDASASMKKFDRLEQLKASLQHLAVLLRPMDRLTVIAYSGTARTVFGPQKDVRASELNQTIQSISGGGKTNVLQALEKGYAYIAASDRKYHRLIILTTDGDFEWSRRDQRSINKAAEEQGAATHVFHYAGTNERATTLPLLQNLSQGSQGDYHLIRSEDQAIRTLIKQVKKERL